MAWSAGALRPPTTTSQLQEWRGVNAATVRGEMLAMRASDEALLETRCQRCGMPGQATRGLVPADEKVFLWQVPFLEPEPYELAAYGEGGAWPARRGEPAPATDWEKDFGGAALATTPHVRHAPLRELHVREVVGTRRRPGQGWGARVGPPASSPHLGSLEPRLMDG